MTTGRFLACDPVLNSSRARGQRCRDAALTRQAGSLAAAVLDFAAALCSAPVLDKACGIDRIDRAASAVSSEAALPGLRRAFVAGGN